MVNKVFGSTEWSEEHKTYTGLPRPFSKVLPINRKRHKLSAKVPIPWQSGAKNNQERFLKIIQENEDIVYYKDLCSYCGIKINNSEDVIRWKNPKINEIRHNGSFVFSDIHPIHLECMRQTRLYCPGMKKVKEEEFEYGKYQDLKYNAEMERSLIMEKQIKELVNVFYFTADWCQPCKNIKPIVSEINMDRVGLKFHTIDADSEKELVKMFEIKSLPTFIIIANGKEIKRLTGSQTKQTLLTFLNSAENGDMYLNEEKGYVEKIIQENV
jgi:thiol-disulfide isomerase/thioredoxin